VTNALREVADAAQSRKSLDGELSASRAAVTAAAEAHSMVSKRYQGELATYFDVLSAEDQLISAERGLADVETRAMVLDVALVRTLGGGFQSADKTSNTPAITN
jgi:outer membrane protein TolC